MARQPKGRTKHGTPTKTGTKHAACKYTPALGQEICARLAEGETLSAICRTLPTVDRSTVTKWVLAGKRLECRDLCLREFAHDYTRAREIAYLNMGDEIIDIVDDSRDDMANGRPNNAKVQRDKLRADSRKWMLAKMLPKIYGDSKTVTHEGGDRPIEVNHRDLARTMIEVLGTHALETVDK